MNASSRWQLLVLTCGLVAGIGSQKTSAVTVTPTGDPATLANTVRGSGIFSTSGETFTGSADAAGTFTGGGGVTGIGIESGIILSTGSAAAAQGPNGNATDPPGEFDEIGFGADFDNGTPGDSALTALIGAGRETFDAAVLEFDFETTGGDLFVDFVFASEEYSDFINSDFNDVFAFYVDGVNIALVPGTTTPISVNTVNGSVTPGLFHDNTDPGGVAPFDLEYDGFTTPLTASFPGLTPGVHRFKIAIADGSRVASDPTEEDHYIDSAVFIEAGSFSLAPTGGSGGPGPGGPGPTPVPLPAAVWMGLCLLGGLGAVQLAQKARARQA